MRTREYSESDLETLSRIQGGQGFAYPFPDLRGPIFVPKLVLEDDFGRVVMASSAHVEARVNPRPRVMPVNVISRCEECEKDLLARDLDDAQAWLPPPIAKRLEALGWLRDDTWTPHCFRLGGKD